jgi:hypothetical protein
MKSARRVKVSKAKRKTEPSPEEAAGLPRRHGAGPYGIEGAVAGAAIGAMAGPVGIVAGSAIGGLIGAVAEEVLNEEEARRSKHDAELDEEIGVTGGTMGAAKPNQPPARFGAYSSASSGAGGMPSHDGVSSGPMQDIDED